MNDASSNARNETNMGWNDDETWPYTVLSEPDLSSELARLSFECTIGQTHCVSFQPNGLPENWNQDRYVVEDFVMDDGTTWKFRAVFDGHLGHETVDYAVEIIPSMVKKALVECLDLGKSSKISAILSNVITTFDNSIAEDILAVLPSREELSRLSDDEIRMIINDPEPGGVNSRKMMRGMQGTTAVLVLVGPGSEDMWIASLGDSQAVLGIQQSSGEWEATVLSTNHTGYEMEEAQRLIREHPHEPEVLVRGRVLGALAVTRAIGDHPYKLPRIYTDRVFLNAQPGWSRSQRDFVHFFIERNITPPYVSSLPDVRYVSLTEEKKKGNSASRACLIMCSDGLNDLYNQHSEKETDPSDLAKKWIQVSTAELGGAEFDSQLRGCGNRALHLLRDALGGADEDKVSRMITVEMEEKWMDDTTILFEFL